ncbi:MAG: AAA family ATPase [Muribaculaceae bacterium]|nr:AAA family ATPase [Muribaculaceae bacterium]
MSQNTENTKPTVGGCCVIVAVIAIFMFLLGVDAIVVLCVSAVLIVMGILVAVIATDNSTAPSTPVSNSDDQPRYSSQVYTTDADVLDNDLDYLKDEWDLNHDDEDDDFDQIDNIPAFDVLVEPEDYRRLAKALRDALRMCRDMSADSNLRHNVLNKANDRDTIQGEFGPDDFYDTLKLMLAKDMFCCIEHLEHSVEIDYFEASGQTLYILMMMLTRATSYKEFRCEMESEGDIPDQIRENREEMLQVYKNNTVGVRAEGVDDLSLAMMVKLGEKADAYLHDVYRVMRRLSRAIAQACGDDTTLIDEWFAAMEKDGFAPQEESSCSTAVSTESATPIEDLKNLIGLQRVKKEVSALNDFIVVNRQREAMGMKVPSISYHCVFTGNPGTGKTTVARIIAGIYKQLGILKKGHLVETDRSGLVAEYLGQTAVKTNKVIDSALDGVLFIDEAYSLVQGAKEDYGKEAIATLLKRMEDDRQRLVVILAGYADEMKQFIGSNPGLKSRFNRYIHFDDYMAQELFQIFEKNITQYDFSMTDDAAAYLRECLVERVESKDKDFGNARFVRNLFEKSIEAQAVRLNVKSATTKEQLGKIIRDDIATAFAGVKG